METSPRFATDSDFCIKGKFPQPEDLTKRYVELAYMRAMTSQSKKRLRKTFSSPGRKSMEKVLRDIKFEEDNNKASFSSLNTHRPETKEDINLIAIKLNERTVPRGQRSCKTTAVEVARAKLRATLSLPLSATAYQVSSNRTTFPYCIGGSQTSHREGYRLKVNAPTNPLEGNDSRCKATAHRHNDPNYVSTKMENDVYFLNDNCESSERNISKRTIESQENLQPPSNNDNTCCQVAGCQPVSLELSSGRDLIITNGHNNIITITDEKKTIPRIRLESVSSDITEFSRTIVSQPECYNQPPARFPNSKRQPRYSDEAGKDGCLTCLHHTKQCVRCCTCVWCIEAVCYHCTKDDIGYSAECSEGLFHEQNGRQRCCQLSLLGLVSLFLPCIWGYPLLSISLNACVRCRKRHIDHHCT